MATKRERVKAKFGGKCAYCGEMLGDRWHVDHMEPIQRDMKWDGMKSKMVHTGECAHPSRKTEENEFPACIPCNMNKSSLPLEYWRKQIEARLEALNKYSTDYRVAKRFWQVKETPSPVRFYFERVNPPKCTDCGNFHWNEDPRFCGIPAPTPGENP